VELAQLEAQVLEALEGRGWKVQRGTSREPLLPPEISGRYPRIPAELVSFLERMDVCVNADETVWFLCRADFRTGAEGFRWNEFELMTLESGNAEWNEQARQFWDHHFPFMLCVHSDYDYLAVNLEARSYGQIVHGCGPTFEETSIVAPSFAEFLASFNETVAGRRDEYPLSFFV
jgi:hypothetical protein